MSQAIHHDDALENEPYGAHHYDFVKVWAVLVGLLIVSVVGPMLEVRPLTLITAFGIALVKAYLVIRFFMHLTVEKKYVLYMLGTMLLFVFLFFSAVAPDVLNHEGTNWTNTAANNETKRVLLKAREGTVDDHHAAHHEGGEHHEAGANHAATEHAAQAPAAAGDHHAAEAVPTTATPAAASATPVEHH